MMELDTAALGDMFSTLVCNREEARALIEAEQNPTLKEILDMAQNPL
jgi:hypothetical protein